MDNPVVLQGLGVILVLFFIFTMVMSAKNWKWFNIFIAFLVFGATIYFLLEATFVLKNWKTWREVVNNLQRQLEPELKTKEALVYGSTENAADPLGTLPKAIAEVERSVTMRGRVWRNCTPDSVADGSVKLTTPQSAPPPAPPMAPPPAAPPMPDPAAMPAADPNAPPADPNAPPADPNAAPADPNAAPMPMPMPMAEAPAPVLEVRPNGIKVKTVLYLFKDRDKQPNDTFTIPFVYVGEWYATEVTDTSVTLAPNLPLDQQQKDAIAAPGTFTIYEVLPIDSMLAFDDFYKVAGAQRTQEQMIAMIPKLPLADPKLQAAYDKSYENMIRRYVRDGQEATADDQQDTVWTQVKFKKTHKVTVDSTQTGDLAKPHARDVAFFDANGLAVMNHLRNGEEVTFKLGETGTFNQADAKKLIDDDICEEVAKIYRRPLNDYKHHFHQIYNRVDLLTNRIEEVTRQTNAITEANRKVEAIVNQLKEERDKLDDDKKKFLAELAMIKAYVQKIEQARDASRGRVVELYRKNLELSNKIAARQKELTDDINRKTLEATASATKP